MNTLIIVQINVCVHICMYVCMYVHDVCTYVPVVVVVPEVISAA